MTLAILCVLTVSSHVAADAFAKIEPALAAAESAPSSPVLRVVRGEMRGPLVAEDINDTLAAARALEPALGAIDAATSDAACALPADGARAIARARSLADALLVTATVDAAAGKPVLAAANVSRAADVARLLVRCDGASLESFGAGAGAVRRARNHVAFLMEQRWLDQKGALRAAAALDPPTDAELSKASGPRAAKADVDAMRAQLKADMADEKRLVARASGAPAQIEQGDQVRAPDVDVRCEATKEATRFVVSRPVLAVLRARGPDAVVADSQLFFSLDGSGLIVVRAGPAARSCGFHDGDVLLDVNGHKTASPQDTLAMPEAVAHEGKALFRVRRAGSVVELLVEPKSEPTPAP